MRSRYTAYALGQVAHILRTTHPDSPHRASDTAAWREELRAYCAATSFVRLEVLAAQAPSHDEGFVHFRAHWERGGQSGVQEERSRFLRHRGKWAYLTGV